MESNTKSLQYLMFMCFTLRGRGVPINQGLPKELNYRSLINELSYISYLYNISVEMLTRYGLLVGYSISSPKPGCVG